MSDENVELIKRLALPAEADWTEVFRDDVVLQAVEPFVGRDFQGSLIIWGQVETEFTE